MNPPPLLISFPDVDHYLAALSDELAEEFSLDIRRLTERQLPPVVSKRCLAVLFGYSRKFIGALARGSSRYYRHFTISKGRRKRYIDAPRVSLKVIQKWIGYHIAEAISFPPYVFGFVRGRSAVQAAAVHCTAKWVYSIDIRDFFQNTKVSFVSDSLIKLGYPLHGAELIAALCCYKGGLAQGSPASPVLSNIVFQSADLELSRLAARLHVQYSRYADDIVFSGHEGFPREIPSEARRIVESFGWKIANKKEKISISPQRLKVHGLLVHRDMPRLTKGYRNRIRAYKHLMSEDKVANKDISRLKGHLAYAASVDQFCPDEDVDASLDI